MSRFPVSRVSRTHWPGAGSAIPGVRDESEELEDNHVGIRGRAGGAAGLAGFAACPGASQVGSGSESQHDRGGVHSGEGSPTAAVAQEKNENQGQRQTVCELAFCISEGHQDILSRKSV